MLLFDKILEKKKCEHNVQKPAHVSIQDVFLLAARVLIFQLAKKCAYVELLHTDNLRPPSLEKEKRVGNWQFTCIEKEKLFSLDGIF